MAVTIGGAIKSSGTSNTRTVSIPSSIVDGDYWLILFTKDDQDLVTPPSGWSTIYNIADQDGDDRSIAGFYKHFPTAPVSTVDITGADAEEWVTASMWVRNADASTFLSGTAGTHADSQNSSSPVASAPNSGGIVGDLTVSHIGTRSNGIAGVVAPTDMDLLAAFAFGTGAGDAQLGAATEQWVDNNSHTFTNVTGTRDWMGVTFVIKGADPFITDVETTEEYDDNDTDVTITGVNFEASQGSGKVEMGDDSDYATANKVEQTTTSWGDTSIDFTANLGSQSPGSKWVFVTNNTGDKNDPGFAVTVHREQAFKMAASSNIAASGEDTTVQLTAPASKTTGDFDAGRIQDDENPADAVDITLDDYTELEFCVSAKNAARLVQYAFRITRNGALLNTYAVIPRLTITTPPAGGGPTVGSLALMGIGR